MKRISLLICFMMVLVCAHAETIVLRTGARVEGTIVFQNEEVVIIRDAEGARFQYPRAEVESIVNSEELIVKSEGGEISSARDVETSNDLDGGTKKASILLELGGGGAVSPGDAAGGGFSVDFLVGSHHIGNKHLFIGGGLGYHGLFIGGAKYNFLPIQVALRMPLMEQKHAPAFGVSLGYGVALSKAYVGGLYAGLDFGYRYQINPKTALAVMINAQFQQAKVTVTETIGEDVYTHKTGRYLIMPGIKLALYF